MKALIKPALLLLIIASCLFAFVLNRESGVFREFEAALLSLQWMLLVCLVIWCGTFLFLTFSLKDLPLVGLLLIAIVAFFISQAENRPATDAITLLFGVTLGKGAKYLLSEDGKWKMEDPAETQKAESENNSILVIHHLSRVSFLLGLVLLLAFSAFWHLDMTNNYYHGPRWMGLWNNPNDYGLLMSAGFVLAIGLLAARERKEHKDAENRKAESGKRKLLRSLRSFAAVKSSILNPLRGCGDGGNGIAIQLPQVRQLREQKWGFAGVFEGQPPFFSTTFCTNLGALGSSNPSRTGNSATGRSGRATTRSRRGRVS